MLMHCLEWWLYEIAGFLAGIISEVELAAQSVMYQLALTAYVVTPSPRRTPDAGGGAYSLLSQFLPALQIPLGFSAAASVRVGNALGAGNTERAKLSSKVSLIFTRMDHTVTPPSVSCSAPFGGQTPVFLRKKLDHSSNINKVE